MLIDEYVMQGLLKAPKELERKRSRPGAISLRDYAKHVAASTARGFSASVEPCTESDLTKLNTKRSTLDAEREIASGRVAHVILAGGSASCLGTSIVAPIPHVGVSLLANSLMQSDARVEPSVMVSPTAFSQITTYVSSLVPTPSCVIFEQFEAYSLDPMLTPIVTQQGLKPTGTGDVFAALEESDIIAESPHKQHYYVTSVSNGLAIVNESLLQLHVSSGARVTVEVVAVDDAALPSDDRTDAENHEAAATGPVSPSEPFLAWADGDLRLLDAAVSGGSRDLLRFRPTGTYIFDKSVVCSRNAQRLDTYVMERTHSDNTVSQHLERHVWSITQSFPTSYVLVDSSTCYHAWSRKSFEALGRRLDANRR